MGCVLNIVAPNEGQGKALKCAGNPHCWFFLPQRAGLMEWLIAQSYPGLLHRLLWHQCRLHCMLWDPGMRESRKCFYLLTLLCHEPSCTSPKPLASLNLACSQGSMPKLGRGRGDWQHCHHQYPPQPAFSTRSVSVFLRYIGERGCQRENPPNVIFELAQGLFYMKYSEHLMISILSESFFFLLSIS